MPVLDAHHDLGHPVEITCKVGPFRFGKQRRLRHVQLQTAGPGTDHDQRPHPGGVRQGEVHGQSAAHGTAHQDEWLVDLQGVEQGCQVPEVAELAIDRLAPL